MDLYCGYQDEVKASYEIQHRKKKSTQLYGLNFLEMWEAMEDVETRFLSLHEALNNNILPLYKDSVLLWRKNILQCIKERKKNQQNCRYEKSKENYFQEHSTTRNCSRASLWVESDLIEWDIWAGHKAWASMINTWAKIMRRK